MPKAVLAAFHIVFATFVFVFVATVENNIFFFYLVVWPLVIHIHVFV